MHVCPHWPTPQPLHILWFPLPNLAGSWIRCWFNSFRPFPEASLLSVELGSPCPLPVATDPTPANLLRQPRSPKAALEHVHPHSARSPLLMWVLPISLRSLLTRDSKRKKIQNPKNSTGLRPPAAAPPSSFSLLREREHGPPLSRGPPSQTLTTF